MAIYLQVRTANIHVMLNALHVHEVLNMEAVLTGATDHAHWRNELISTLQLSRLLNQSGSGEGTMGVVYSPEQDIRPVMLMVDEILGLKNLTDSQWRHLPRIPSASAALFDLVWLEPEVHRQSYRLRHPLPLTLTEA